MSKTNVLLSGIVAVLVLAVLMGGGSSVDNRASGVSAPLSSFETSNKETLNVNSFGRTPDPVVVGKPITTLGTSDTFGNPYENPSSPSVTTQTNTQATSPYFPSGFLSKPLSFGMKNDGDVMKLQTALRLAGCFNFLGDATGNYGSITSQGIKDCQRKFGLPVTGTADQSTLNALLQGASLQCGQLLNSAVSQVGTGYEGTGGTGGGTPSEYAVFTKNEAGVAISCMNCEPIFIDGKDTHRATCVTGTVGVNSKGTGYTCS